MSHQAKLQRARDWRAANREKVKTYNRRYQAAHRADHTLWVREWREEHPERLAAQQAVGRAVRHGIIAVLTECEECGDSEARLQGHHADYSKPLEVTWLCPGCHRREHGHL